MSWCTVTVLHLYNADLWPADVELLVEVLGQCVMIITDSSDFPQQQDWVSRLIQVGRG